mmetsp:Transcript_63537/g.139218  ORF Transcript_63537/g.139218 Transcript_63537/m.139218 type:complete len:228 (-) Transcript_63537:885-1568(-)
MKGKLIISTAPRAEMDKNTRRTRTVQTVDMLMLGTRKRMPAMKVQRAKIMIPAMTGRGVCVEGIAGSRPRPRTSSSSLVLLFDAPATPEWLVFMARGQRMRIREEQTKENVHKAPVETTSAILWKSKKPAKTQAGAARISKDRAGAPKRFTRTRVAGRRPSCAMAKHKRGCARTQPITVVKVFPSAPMATSTASQCRPRSSAAEANGAVWLMSVYFTNPVKTVATQQ